MCRSIGVLSRRLLTLTVSAAVTLTAAGPASPQATLNEESPFHRVVEELHPDARWSEEKLSVGWDLLNALVPRVPYRSGQKRVPVDEANTLRLGDLVVPGDLTDDAFGIIVVVDSVYGRNHHYVSLRSGNSRASFSDRRLAALPRSVNSREGRRIKSVNAWAREVFTLPSEYRTGPIAVPARGAKLHFAVGFEDVLERAGVRRIDERTDNDGKQVPSVRAQVFVESQGVREPLYDDVLQPIRATPNKRRYRQMTVDLGAFAGRDVRLIFRFESASTRGQIDGAFSLPIWGNPVVYATHAALRNKPNVLMISLDTLRADHLGAYGYDRDTSPNIDRFAEEGVLFENCLSTSSWTTPAHASVFTGLPLSIHEAGGRDGWRLRGSVTTLSELARRNGYLTAAFTHGHALAGDLGFAQGFDQYSNGPLSGQTPDSTLGSAAEQIFAQGRAWLEEFGHLPFFLFLHTYEIHAPYLPPEPFAKRFTDQSARDGFPKAEMASAEERDRIVGLYDGGIAYTDHVLGGLLDYLRDAGLLETTHVILFSDHGEEFWEHGGVEHSFTLFQEQLHVPLIVRIAGEEPPRGRIQQRVSLADLFATTLDLMGADYEAPSHSISLVPFIRNGEGPYPRTVFRSELFKIKNDYYMISGISDRYKLIAKTHYDQRESPIHESKIDGKSDGFASDPIAFLNFLARRQGLLADTLPDKRRARLERAATEELFDLKTDPKESASIHAAQPDTVRALREALLADLRQSADEAARAGMEHETVRELTEREREELRALGYLD